MKFKHGTRRKAIEYEKDWVKRWKDSKTFEKSVENRPSDNAYVFYDGPPFITGNPHHGTLLSSIVKDAVPRYWTMKGKRVERVWGWDTHGLPAENFVEKQLGIVDRRQIVAENETTEKDLNANNLREISREIVGGAIISSDDKVLLGHNRKDGVYEGLIIVPGGGVDEGETKLEALRREMLEEVGIDINDFDVEKVDIPMTGTSEKTLQETGERVFVSMTFYNYTMRSDKPASDLVVKLEDDFAWAKWFSRDELLEQRFSPSTAKLLKKLGFLPEEFANSIDHHDSPVLDKDGNPLPTISLEKYITKARESMVANAETWEEVVDRIGRWVDFQGAYKTMDKNFMESVWWAFKELYDKGKIYEGEKVLMYDTKFATPVSKNEVTMDNDAYQTVTDPSVYVKFKLKSNRKKQIALTKTSKVLFVCNANVGRSQIAQGFYNDFTKSNDAESAGVHPDKGWGEHAILSGRVAALSEQFSDFISPIDIMLEVGINVANQSRKLITKGRLDDYDLVVNIAERSQTPEWLRGDNVIWWDVPDPTAEGGGAVLRTARDEIARRVKELISGEIRDDDIDSTHLLAWTTTPWTLPANTAIGVGRDIDYVEVEIGGERLILAKALVEKVLVDDKKQPLEYKIVRELKGAELIGLGYEPLLGVHHGENAHKVWEYPELSATEGTGIVHLAPIYGEADFELAKANDIPRVHVLDDNGFYYPEVAEKLFKLMPWVDSTKPLEVWDNNKNIAKGLQKAGIVWKTEYIQHEYPFNPRSKQRIMYRVIPSWFFDIQGSKALMLEQNENVNWFPEHLKHGRFAKNIEQAPDWNLSRDRFWATAMPVWKGDKGTVKVVGSYAELKELSGVELDDYHRPWVDDIEFDLVDGKPINDQVDLTISEEFGYIVFNVTNYIESMHLAKEVDGLALKTDEFHISLIKLPDNVDDDMRREIDAVSVKAGLDLQKKRPKLTGEFKWAIDKERGRETIIGLVDFPGLEAWRREIRKVLPDVEFSIPHVTLYTKPGEGAIGINSQDDYDKFVHDLDVKVAEQLAIHSETEHFTRIDKVLDCWFESGSMPFAQFHYPFENKEKFEANYPGDFIVEYVAQVRAWFYYVHVVNTALFGEEAFKNVITTGTLAGNDGRKMSKSLGNYTDPNELMDKYSADSLRFLLMSSPVLNGEDFSLQDKDVQDVARKLSMVWNMYDFFTMYAEVDGWEFDGELAGLFASQPSPASTASRPISADGHSLGESISSGARERQLPSSYSRSAGNAEPSELDSPKSLSISLANPLDIWIVSRLHQLNQQITENMDAYNLPDALSPILPFIDDASNWFVRRSRRRFWRSSVGAEGSEDDGDKNDAYRTLHYVLLKLSVILAPFTPFLAEELYQKMGGGAESVHLLDWPGNFEVNEAVMNEMDEVRDFVNQALGLRAKLGLKVRQPLASVTVPNLGKAVDYEAILLDELNVKSVKIGKAVALDEKITPELKREGLMREVIRVVQNARKNAGLNVDDRINLGLETSDSELTQAIDEHGATIQAETLATDAVADDSYQETVTLEGVELTVSIKKSET